MRRLILAAALLLAAVSAVSAASLANKTQQSYSPGHSMQIEYLAADGASWLWYPGNTKVLAGEWKAEGSDLCFRYGKNTYNPVTRQKGGGWDCAPLKVYNQTLVSSTKGDIFGLAGRKKVPFDLPKKLLPITQLQAIADPSIVEREQAKLPSCEQILADADKSRAAKISAALLYYHGMQMGKRCVTFDYVKAITMLNEAGETRTAASLVKDLSSRANNGNLKAENALKKLQKLGLVKEVRVQ
jgi:hypothetical protein